MKSIPVRNINQHPEPKLSGSYSVRDLTPLLAGNDMVQELHRHDFFYILIIKKGSGRHDIDFTPYDIRDHSVFVMRPGQVHFLHLKAEGSGYLIQFKTDFLDPHHHATQNHLTKLIQYNTYRLEPEGFTKLENMVLNALKEYTEKQKGYQEVLKAHLSIFLIELLRQRQEKLPQQVPATPYAQEKLEEFLALIEARMTTHKQVSQYTELLHLSSYQLSAITKSLLNKTPSEMINGAIILEAKRLLLATSCQVGQIAFQLGYEDPSYFTRFFKKHTATSPEIFRQNFR